MRSQLPSKLQAIVASECGPDPRSIALFEDFLHATTYSRSFTVALLEVATGGAGDTWPVRQLATLMLEHQVLQMPTTNDEDAHFLLTRLGLSSPQADRGQVHAMVLQEGYTTTEGHAFLRELRHKLGRLNRVHHQIRGEETTETGLRDFMHLARRPCKLALARYVFTPQEVVQQVQQQVKHSQGLQDLIEPRHPYTADEAQHALSRLPNYEATIVRMLCETSSIYWVSDVTSAETNALVQYPPKTVVLVLKPPGSALEIELKRAGLRGEQVLGVVYEREGHAVPSSHRLNGGSSKWSLQWEAGASALFSKLYRLVHSAQAPISGMISRATIQTIPVGDDEVHVLDYFTDPDIFGADFHAMQEALKRSIAAFRQERQWSLPDLPGALGMAVHLINHVAPAQAVLVGTSAFRLDWLARCLSDGAAAEASGRDPQRCIDELLDEVLGVYLPPPGRYRDPRSYVDAALARPENRTRANRIYLSVMRQIGRFWGTLLAVGGYSNGESVVTRNVGLKSVWDAGQWQVRIVFMDHDGLCIIGKTDEPFDPRTALTGMVWDESHLLGSRSSIPATRGVADCLADIYRIGQETGNDGDHAFHTELDHAYERTQDAMATNAAFQELFHSSILEQLQDWHRCVVQYLEAIRSSAALAAWEEDTRRLLGRKGYTVDLIDEYVRVMPEHAFFLQRQSYFTRQRHEGLGT